MKVVLFCGGKGIRLRDYSDKIPKPMIPVGYRPILWHVMKYYAHFGHKEFILCLGSGGDVIKDYFVNYKEYISNDFTLKAETNIKLLSRDIDDWKITFVDTGINTNTAERLLAVKRHLEDDEYFLVNYSDRLTDLHLPTMIDRFKENESVGMVMTVKSKNNSHATSIDENNQITRITSFKKMKSMWISAGYFIFKKSIFDYIDTSDSLPEKTLPSLVDKGLLSAYPYDGTFLTINTFREKEALDKMYTAGKTPWQVWENRDSKVV